MQLFKSQCLQEQDRPTRLLAYRESAFAPRYGGRGASRRTFCQSELVAGEDVAAVACDPQGRGEPRRVPVGFDRAA